ncbi:MAG: mucoidy inhibitor MuiA family protein [Planctomycetales bacterium]|nr:mucoidy inhibitor MuiA family protein [Planctomycetales bacterium]
MPAQRMLPLLVSVSFALTAAAPARAVESVRLEGRVSAVTVYQGQALVTREVTLDSAGGLSEVVVTNLPDRVLPGSLYAEPVDGVVVRSVRYHLRPVEQDIRQEVRELDAQIQATQDKLSANQRRRELLGEQTEYLKKMEGFTTGTANLELKSGVLNAETLKSLTEFVFMQRTQIAEQQLASQVEERELKQQLEVLHRQRNSITQGSAKTVREAVVFADLGEEGPKKLRLTYLVADATWSPSYNLRADAGEGRVVVEYNASIQQRSGEDWTDVAMTLSTASPSLISTAPSLEPLAIRLAPPTPEQQAAVRDYYATKERLMEEQRKLANFRNSAGNFVQSESLAVQNAADLFAADALAANSPAMQQRAERGFAGMYDFDGNGALADKGLNTFGRQMQILEFNGQPVARSKAAKPAAGAQGISVSYSLAGRTSLPSRADRQLIQIASLPLAGDFYRIATPVLTEFVYKEAKLTNTTDMVLLAGPSATFLEGEFVGRGAVPTVSIGESFAIGLGIDTSLRAGRELVDKSTRTQGGNRVVDFTYELTIENFGDQRVDVRLFDRLPKPDSDDIKVTLVKSDEEVSADEEYQQNDRKNGILRWDLQAPAGSAGLKQTTLSYTLQIEHDRQLQIVGLEK